MVKSNLKIDLIIKYFFVFCIIIECNSAYNRLVDYNLYTDYIYMISILIFGTYVIMNNKIIEKKKFILIFSLITFSLLFLIINVRIGYFSYILKFVIFIPVLLLYFTMKKENIHEMLKIFVNIVFFIACVSLVLYLYCLIWGFGNSIIRIKWGGVRNINNILMLQFNMQNSYSFGKVLLRNTGIFLESPMYSYVLVLAFTLCDYVNKKKLKKIILFITLITTLSTTGIICSTLSIILNYFAKKDRNPMKKIFKVFIGPIMLIGIISLSLNLVDKKAQNESWSYNLRMEDYIASFKAWQENKLFGNGYEDTSATVSHMNYNRRINEDKLGQSNAIGRILSEGGIVLFLFYIIPIIRLIILSINYKENSLLNLSIIYLILLITTNVPYQLLTFFIWSIIFSYSYTLKKQV